MLQNLLNTVGQDQLLCSNSYKTIQTNYFEAMSLQQRVTLYGIFPIIFAFTEV